MDLRISGARNRGEVGISDLLDMLCYRQQRCNLMNLRVVLGDHGLMTMIDQYAGSYFRFPMTSKAIEAINDLVLYRLYQNVRKASKEGTAQWSEAEIRFTKFAERVGISYVQAVRRASLIKSEIAKAREWRAHLEMFDDKLVAIQKEMKKK